MNVSRKQLPEKYTQQSPSSNEGLPLNGSILPVNTWNGAVHYNKALFSGSVPASMVNNSQDRPITSCQVVHRRRSEPAIRQPPPAVPTVTRCAWTQQGSDSSLSEQQPSVGLRGVGPAARFATVFDSRLCVDAAQPILSDRGTDTTHTHGLHTPCTVRLFHSINPLAAVTAHQANRQETRENKRCRKAFKLKHEAGFRIPRWALGHSRAGGPPSGGWGQQGRRDVQMGRSGAMEPGRVGGQRPCICGEIYESSFADSTNKKHVHPEP